MHVARLGSFTALLTFAVAACGGAEGASQSAVSPALRIMVVSDPATIGAYVPSPASVKVGDTVEWQFVDKNPHTVSADDSSFDSTPRANGKTFSFTFNKAGTFTYHCNIHPEMHGTVVVR